MPRKAKIKSINRAQKWKQWYIQQDSKWEFLVFIMLSSSIWAYRLLFFLLIFFHILFIYALENLTLVDHSNKSPPNELTQISPQKTSIVRRKKSNTRTESNISPKKLPLLEEKFQHNSICLNLIITTKFLTSTSTVISLMP